MVRRCELEERELPTEEMSLLVETQWETKRVRNIAGDEQEKEEMKCDSNTLA